MELQSFNSFAVLAFPSPQVYPRLKRATLLELRELLAEVQMSGVFPGAIIAANSHSFATGADVQEVSHLHGVEAFQFAKLGQSVLQEIAHCPLPVVAAIRGYCLGGGLDLALACHARVATYDSTFGHPGASLGLITGWGGTHRLPHLVGKAAALPMLLSGERVPATQALTMGLVDELSGSKDLLAAAARRAEKLRGRG
jgi:enoyl-CoA hydratase